MDDITYHKQTIGCAMHSTHTRLSTNTYTAYSIRASERSTCDVAMKPREYKLKIVTLNAKNRTNKNCLLPNMVKYVVLLIVTTLESLKE